MKVAVGICLLLVAVAVQAQSWTSVGKSDEGEMLIDTGTIRPQGKWMKAWMRFNHAKQQPFRDKSYWVVQSLDYFDCAAGTSAKKQTVVYEFVFSTSPLLTDNVPDAGLNFTDPIPGSLGDTLVRLVCAKRR